MASPAEITQPLPDTLPADFSEWDGGDVSPTLPVKSSGFEPHANSAAVPTLRTEPNKPRVAVSPVVADLRDTSPHVSVKVNLSEEPTSEPRRVYGALDYEVLPVSSISPALIHEANERLFRSFGADSASDDGLEGKSKTRMIVVAGAAGLILILLTLILLFNPTLRHSLFNVKQSLALQPIATDAETATSAQKPSPSTQLTNGAQPTTAETQSSITDLTTNPEKVTAPQVPSNMMHDQLAAPTRISRDIRMMDAKDAPAATGFGPGGTEGLGGGTGTIGSVFGKQDRPKVKAGAPRTLRISAGVATGMLIQKRAPIYPALAKASHTSGTVVLQATISKTGTIDHLQVVSGSAMLQQSATDAVRTWRYKPYMLDNEPVEVETMINVIFSFGN